MRSLMIQTLVVVTGFVGCAPSSSWGPGRGGDRLEVLTSYTIAISKRDYKSAAALLAGPDRMRIASVDAGILPEYRDRIRAMRLTTLLENPLIEVSHGMIAGIPDLLPVLAQASVWTLDSGQAELPGVTENEVPQKKPGEAKEEALRKTAQAFFKSVQRAEWGPALGFLNAKERESFQDRKGNIKVEAKKRLSAVDTASWEALRLMDGRLTGVILIIPEGDGEGDY